MSGGVANISGESVYTVIMEGHPGHIFLFAAKAFDEEWKCTRKFCKAVAGAAAAQSTPEAARLLNLLKKKVIDQERFNDELRKLGESAERRCKLEKCEAQARNMLEAAIPIKQSECDTRKTKQCLSDLQQVRAILRKKRLTAEDYELAKSLFAQDR